MTTTAKAVGNGSTDTGTADQPERVSGMARIRNTEAYHTADILHDAAFEAERLCNAVYQAIYDAYYNQVRTDQKARTGLTVAQTAESPQVQAKLQEALNCLHAAEEYAKRLLVNTYAYEANAPF
jgi:hypothetical protein